MIRFSSLLLVPFLLTSCGESDPKSPVSEEADTPAKTFIYPDGTDELRNFWINDQKFAATSDTFPSLTKAEKGVLSTGGINAVYENVVGSPTPDWVAPHFGFYRISENRSDQAGTHNADIVAYFKIDPADIEKLRTEVETGWKKTHPEGEGEDGYKYQGGAPSSKDKSIDNDKFEFPSGSFEITVYKNGLDVKQLPFMHYLRISPTGLVRIRTFQRDA